MCGQGRGDMRSPELDRGGPVAGGRPGVPNLAPSPDSSESGSFNSASSPPPQEQPFNALGSSSWSSSPSHLRQAMMEISTRLATEITNSAAGAYRSSLVDGSAPRIPRIRSLLDRVYFRMRSEMMSSISSVSRNQSDDCASVLFDIGSIFQSRMVGQVAVWRPVVDRVIEEISHIFLSTTREIAVRIARESLGDSGECMPNFTLCVRDHIASAVERCCDNVRERVEEIICVEVSSVSLTFNNREVISGVNERRKEVRTTRTDAKFQCLRMRMCMCMYICSYCCACKLPHTAPNNVAPSRLCPNISNPLHRGLPKNSMRRSRMSTGGERSRAMLSRKKS